MPWANVPLLFLAGALAGALNALAGGGGFITLPAFLFSGTTAIIANTTGTAAVWPGIASALYAQRARLSARAHPLGLYAVLAVAGGALGAYLLLFTSNDFFLALLPWLLLFATTILVFGNRLTAFVMGQRALPRAVVHVFLFIIAVYGGYFGGGMGIMTLATLALLGMRDIHEMNALKAYLTGIINLVSLVVFAALGKVDWLRCAPMAVGCVAGGYAAGRWMQGAGRDGVRRAVIVLAVTMTLLFFWKAYWK
jgi:uncharacterized membrane protein YfcA